MRCLIGDRVTGVFWWVGFFLPRELCGRTGTFTATENTSRKWQRPYRKQPANNVGVVHIKPLCLPVYFQYIVPVLIIFPSVDKKTPCEHDVSHTARQTKYKRTED